MDIARRIPLWHGLGQDFRCAVRQMSSHPFFSAVAILTLSLGIGPATAVYVCLHSLLFAGAPPVDLSRRVSLWSAQVAGTNSKVLVSGRDYIEWKSRTRSLDLLAAAQTSAANLGAVGQPVRVPAQQVTATFFPMLGIRMALGRPFTRDDERSGSVATAILGADLWRENFAASPAVLGRRILVNGQTATIIGVMLPNVFGADLLLPLDEADLATSRARTLFVMGRLRPGVTTGQARAEMASVGKQLVSEYPDADRGWTINTRPLKEEFLGPNAALAYGLLAAAALLLFLIACANVGGLLLARGFARHREMAMRAALGAGRFRIARQIVVEALLLTTAGAGLGALVAQQLLGWMRATFSMPPIILAVMRFRASAAACTGAGAVSAAILVSVLAVLQAQRMKTSNGLQEASARTIGGRRVRRAQAILVTGQVALATVLVVVAALVSRTLLNLQAIADEGFDAHGVLTASVTLPADRYSPTEIASFFQRVADRIRSDSLTDSASAVSRVPAAGSRFDPNRTIIIKGRTSSPQSPVWALDLTALTGYFRVLRIPLIEGRDFTAGDQANAPLVAVVNQSMARRYWPGRSPLGAQLRLGNEPSLEAWRTVVGVVGDVRNDKITDPPLPEIFLPLAQQPTRTMTIVVRGMAGHVPPPELIRSAVAGIDPQQPMYDMKTLDEVLRDDLAGSRSLVELLGLFAAFALLLGTSGTFALVSFAVTSQAPEMGIRIALGAGPRRVVQLVIGQTLWPVAAGLTAGLLGAFAVCHLMRSILYEVSATDPATYAGAAILFIAVATLAAAGPAIRAANLDPQVVLRDS